MSDVTRILSQIDQGNPNAAEQLLPLVYRELRNLAAAKLAKEQPGQTLQATALVHEAYLRLLGDSGRDWDSRAHFFAAAAEAMRRILIDQARRKQSKRHGGEFQRHSVDDVEVVAPEPSEEWLIVHEVLGQLEERDGLKADLVKLRYFAGFTVPQAADALGISVATAERYWAYSRAWLHNQIKQRRSGTAS